MAIRTNLEPSCMTDFPLDKEYIELVSNLKNSIRNAQLKAFRQVNQELIKLYWEMGQQITEQQKQTQWGSKFLENLSKDLQKSFPGAQGFSLRNIKLMRQFYQEYPQLDFGQQPVAQLGWSQLITLTQKVKDRATREWYAQQAIENGWSRNVLIHQIETKLYERKGSALSNFKDRLPEVHSRLVENTVKDPYIFDFLTIGEKAHEREIEGELTAHIRKFLLELGAGFSFVGNQFHLKVGTQDFYIDMLFYNYKLRSFFVVELKARAFSPEDAGKLNFYLTAVDKQLKHDSDNPTIGILLCKSSDKIVAEYSLQGMSKPMGVSQYQFEKAIPEQLKTELPSIEEIEEGLNRVVEAKKAG